MRIGFNSNRSFLLCVTLFIVLIFSALHGIFILQNFSQASTISIDVDKTLPNTGQVDNKIIPSNISIVPEGLEEGTLYLSSIQSNNTIVYTRDLTDELYPFQLVNWYPLVQFRPNYDYHSPDNNVTINNLLIGQIKDFNKFNDLLQQASLYKNIPFNSTVILDLPNKEISFMEAELVFPNGESGIYYGLYDGNQKSNKSEVNVYINPESNLKMLESNPATEIMNNEFLYNITFTLVCHDAYKLGYNKCT